LRFAKAERRTQATAGHGFATLNLAPPVERLDATGSFTPLRMEQAGPTAPEKVALPVSKTAGAGVGANVKKLRAALSLEFRLLLSKCLATVLLHLALIASVALVAIGLQLYKGDAPVALSGYLLVYALILLPSVVVIAACAVLLNVLLRDKYLTYAASIAIGGG